MFFFKINYNLIIKIKFINKTIGNIEIANMLIQGGANVNLLNEYNQTVLQAIAYDGKK